MSQTLALILPVTGVSHCPENSEWVCCLHCGAHLGLSQPSTQEPERMIGTCRKCGRWYLLDWHPHASEGCMILLPDHASLLKAFAECPPAGESPAESPLPSDNPPDGAEGR
ncbi:MAG: hypothetical protein ABS79_01065 [Planctomycetes bacterium SCN 63-9]|nr:MAG: hypothetical protein ABS79_01065 [Planctomycetes bacterium SCN 63-9]